LHQKLLIVRSESLAAARDATLAAQAARFSKYGLVGAFLSAGARRPCSLGLRQPWATMGETGGRSSKRAIRPTMDCIGKLRARRDGGWRDGGDLALLPATVE
jgi:hypothetical protein